MNSRKRCGWLVLALALGLSAGACSDKKPTSKCSTKADCKADQGCSGGECVACTPALVGCACGSGGICEDGLVCDGTLATCREPIVCADAGCVANQLCQEAALGQDAECLPECDNGLFWNGATGACEDVLPSCDPGSPNSIVATCDSLFRECEELPGGATCGICKNGYVDVTGICEVQITCTELNCAAELRVCEELPNGHCGDCLPGFLEDTGTGDCRLPVTCVQVSCDVGWYCVEPAEVADAYCREGDCGPQAVLGPGDICYGCPACDDAAAGEAGPFLGGLTGENKCICETQPGYFWREGLFPGVFPCDADNDGWVRESAKNPINSTNQVVEERARCDLRSINAIVLHADEHPREQPGVQPTLTHTLSTPLELYETDRNDDQALLDQAIVNGDLPAAYGPGFRQLKAEEINSLTKACVSSQADVNENGLADLNEWHGNPSIAVVKTTYKGFVDFVYFLELHRGWYEPPAIAGDPGIYHIREKSRLTSAPDGERIGLTYGAGGDDFWQECSRFQDTGFDTYTELVGLDFASFEASGDWTGMNHHSQFKCVQIVDDRSAGDPPSWLSLNPAHAPFYIDPTVYQMNSCELGVSTGPLMGTVSINPWDPVISCSPWTAALQNGDVGWAVIKYQDYTAPGGYTFGCVNECIEFKSECPGYDPVMPWVTQCDRETNDFGLLYCGCGRNYAGTACDYGCPDSDLLLSPGFDIAPRTGYWMCGHISASSYADQTKPYLAEDLSAPTTGYKMESEIPAKGSAVGRLCQNDGGCATDQFVCDATATCLARANVCDGATVCSDGADEAICGSCPPGQIECDAGCQPNTTVCDGTSDCSDGVDEAYCVCNRGYTLR